MHNHNQGSVTKVANFGKTSIAISKEYLEKFNEYKRGLQAKINEDLSQEAVIRYLLYVTAFEDFFIEKGPKREKAGD